MIVYDDACDWCACTGGFEGLHFGVFRSKQYCFELGKYMLKVYDVGSERDVWIDDEGSFEHDDIGGVDCAVGSVNEGEDVMYRLGSVDGGAHIGLAVDGLAETEDDIGLEIVRENDRGIGDVGRMLPLGDGASVRVVPQLRGSCRDSARIRRVGHEPFCLRCEKVAKNDGCSTFEDRALTNGDEPPGVILTRVE